MRGVRTAATLAVGVMIGATVPAVADGVTRTAVVPLAPWAHRVCTGPYDVDCHTAAGQLRRQLPGPRGTVCVFYARRPRLDYCD